MASTQDLDNRFQYHKPTEITGAQHQRVRVLCRDLAEALDSVVPEGREKSLMLTNLEQTMFWANAAIARQGEVSDV